ncbi:solute carrier family 23 member 1-like isoform X1 [Argonauta hians]
MSILVAEFVCGSDDEVLKTKLICTTMFMSGVSTFLQNTIGIRIPLYQGPASAYIVPLIAMGTVKEWSCDIGNLLVAGAIQMLASGLGLLGLLLRVIGPVTVVPAITLVGLSVYQPASKFSETSWGITFFVLALGVTLSLYLSKWSVPMVAWTPKKGFRVKRTQHHKSMAILICIVSGWLLCGVFTATNVFPSDRTSKSFNARTDARIHIVKSFDWFYFPYPLQFGFPKFSIGIFVNFFVATVISVIDSIGDYYACAQIIKVPAPPVHAVNRGLFVEGACSFFSALLGAGIATTTFGSNIGIVGMTKVASRRVFQIVGLVYIIFGIMGKVGAVFITIPYPVLGGVLLLSIGIFIGVALSNLQYIDLNSTRNIAIIGMGLLLGLVIPYYGENNPDAFDTGIEGLTSAIRMMLQNPTFVGGGLACFLDNTIPGTLKERGITTWMPDISEDTKKKSKKFLIEQDKIYGFPFLPKRILDSWLFAALPFLPSGRHVRLVEDGEDEEEEVEEEVERVEEFEEKNDSSLAKV